MYGLAGTISDSPAFPCWTAAYMLRYSCLTLFMNSLPYVCIHTAVYTASLALSISWDAIAVKESKQY
jgi:hypothetical protein